MAAPPVAAQIKRRPFKVMTCESRVLRAQCEKRFIDCAIHVPSDGFRGGRAEEQPLCGQTSAQAVIQLQSCSKLLNHQRCIARDEEEARKSKPACTRESWQE
jgi:hypothetical protein